MKCHMIKILLSSVMILFSGYTAKAQQIQTTDIVTDSILCYKTDRLANCKIIVDYPLNNKTLVDKSIIRHINSEVGIQSNGNLIDAENKIVCSVDSTFAVVRNEALMLRNEGMSIYGPFESFISVRKKSENDKTVTFATTSYSYSGGAHGSSSYNETTFIKSSGKIIGINIFKDPSSSAFKRLIINGLKKYFNTITDAELKDCLLYEGSLNKLPLPASNTISLTKEGVKFTYQQYEIAPYAAGMPEAIIPYDLIKSHIKADYLQFLQP